MTIRELMKENRENLGWCKPYTSDDGTVTLAIANGELVGAVIDGEDIKASALDKINLTALAKRVNPDYDDYDGYDDLHIIRDAMHTKCCADCPWFDICDAMDVDVEENMEKKYTVLPEYRDLWDNDPEWDGTVDEKEIRRLAHEWGKSVEDLMEQVEEL